MINLYRVLRKTPVYYLEIGKNNRDHTVAAVAGHQKILDALERRSLPDSEAALEKHYGYSEIALRK